MNLESRIQILESALQESANHHEWLRHEFMADKLFVAADYHEKRRDFALAAIEASHG